MTPEERFEMADRDVAHWQLILGGSLSTAQRNYARLQLIRSVGRRVRARVELERAAEQVAA